MNAIDNWIYPMNVFHLHVYCSKNTTSIILEGFRNKLSPPVFVIFIKLGQRNFQLKIVVCHIIYNMCLANL